MNLKILYYYNYSWRGSLRTPRGLLPLPNSPFGIPRRYGLSQFSQLCRACRTGNVRLFDDTMAADPANQEHDYVARKENKEYTSFSAFNFIVCTIFGFFPSSESRICVW